MNESPESKYQVLLPRRPDDIVLSDRSPLVLSARRPTDWTGSSHAPVSSITSDSAEIREVRLREVEERSRTDELLELVVQRLSAVDDRRQQLLDELQTVAIELSIAVASHLTFQAIDADNFGVEKIVKSAIERIDPALRTVICLASEDYELLKRRASELLANCEQRNVVINVDSSLARGACEVRQPQGTHVVSDISTRLAEIRRHWLEELDDSQVERRAAQIGGQRLRRFPDRRETA